MQAFFALDSAPSAAAAGLFLLMLWGMLHLPKKRLSFASRVLTGSCCGALFGLAVHWLPAAGGVLPWLTLAARLYLRLFLLLTPLAVLIATVRLLLRSPEGPPFLLRVQRIVSTAMVLLSALVGLTLGTLFQVGSPAAEGLGRLQSGGGSLLDLVEQLVPRSLPEALLSGRIAAIFLLALLIGSAGRRMLRKSETVMAPFAGLTEALFTLLGSMAKTVIAWKPAGAAAIMAALTAESGPAALWWLVRFLLVLVLGAAAMLTLQLVLCALCGVGPTAFLRAGGAAMVKAVKTQSGSACLPQIQEALAEKLGLDREVTARSSALTIASGMQGCGALFPALALVFALNQAGVGLTAGLMAAALTVLCMATWGLTGVPGTATFAEFSALLGTGMGDAAGGLAPMIPIDPLADVPRTLVNVTGSMANAILVERFTRGRQREE